MLKAYRYNAFDNLTKNYKISNDNLIDTINSDSKKIIFERKIKNKKIPKYTKSDAFITIKDHKPKFPFEIECRTLNPGKNQLGLLSKVILERIVNEIRRKSELTQWKNSYEC